jgi:site-specific recombinase XerD
LLYGSDLRLTEALQLRIKDLDFAQNQIIVRDSKDMESRVTMPPNSTVEPLKANLQQVKISISRI